MSGLPAEWTPYAPGAEIPDGFVLYQNMMIPLPAFNALSAQGFFQDPSAMPHATDVLCLAPGDNIQEDTAGSLYNKRFGVQK
ncbi:hypothetical protein DSO57_1035282 [Entomophthora muscae]|uniref:Uncharacterized protein n=1 Tax=Entomophthora muscae TaxID=34485 RepID=A0ACC2RQL1_9FUNG|nr:hypothetical protein DSO57_1035282 [Entomophthora muscae]